MKSIYDFGKILQKPSGKALVFFVVFFVSATLLLGFPSYAHAAGCGDIPLVGAFCDGIVNFFITGLPAIIVAILTLFAVIIFTLTNLVVVIVGSMMDGMLAFATSVPYTPLNPSAVALKEAWIVMRDFANMALLFVLIAIALSTILQLGQRWGGLLISFLIIALLINFTPAITGIIIDLSNIITKIFFTQTSGTWKLFANPAEGGSGTRDLLGQFLGNLNFFDKAVLPRMMAIFFQAIIAVFFNVLLIAAFVAVSLILLARILALWLLVVLSPIAFVAYILPETRKWFQMWWSNFFQWAIIGIPLGVFMFISAKFLVAGISGCGAFPEIDYVAHQTKQAKETLSLVNVFLGSSEMCKLLMRLLSLASLFAGFAISFSFSATGAKMIVSAGTKLGVAAGATVSALAAKGAWGVGAKGAGRVMETGGGKWAKERAAGVKTKMGGVWGKIPQGPWGIKGKTEETVAKWAKQKAKWAKQEAMKAPERLQKGISRMGPAGAAVGEGLRMAGISGADSKPKFRGDNKMSESELKDTVKDKKKARELLERLNRNDMRDIADNYSDPSIVNKLNEYMQEIANNEQDLKKFYAKNPGLVKFFVNPPLGFGFDSIMDQDDFNKLRRRPGGGRPASDAIPPEAHEAPQTPDVGGGRMTPEQVREIQKRREEAREKRKQSLGETPTGDDNENPPSTQTKESIRETLERKMMEDFGNVVGGNDGQMPRYNSGTKEKTTPPEQPSSAGVKSTQTETPIIRHDSTVEWNQSRSDDKTQQPPGQEASSAQQSPGDEGNKKSTQTEVGDLGSEFRSLLGNDSTEAVKRRGEILKEIQSLKSPPPEEPNDAESSLSLEGSDIHYRARRGGISRADAEKRYNRIRGLIDDRKNMEAMARDSSTTPEILKDIKEGIKKINKELQDLGYS